MGVFLVRRGSIRLERRVLEHCATLEVKSWKKPPPRKDSFCSTGKLPSGTVLLCSYPLSGSAFIFPLILRG